MRVLVLMLATLAGVNFAAAQVEPESIDTGEHESAEAVAESELSEATAEQATEVVVSEPAVEDAVDDNLVQEDMAEERWERVPERPGRLTGPLMGVRNSRERRDLEQALKENSLARPLGLLIGGATASVGFTLLSFAVCDSVDDPISGESSCTNATTTGAFLVLGYVGALVTVFGVVDLVVRGVRRRIAYRRYRSRSRFSLTGSGLELNF